MPSRARDVALEVLQRVERDRAFAAPALAAAQSAMGDPRDAALAAELTYGVLRWRPWLDRLLEARATRGLDGLDLRARQVLRLGAYQLVFLDRIPARAAVSEAVDQIKRAGAPGLSGLVNALLRGLAGDSNDLIPPAEDDGSPVDVLADRSGLPAWLLDRFVETRGRERALALARRFNEPARRTMRANAHRGDRRELVERLGDRGVVGELSPWGFDVSDPAAAAALAEEGLAAHQDEGAQLVALALGARPGERVLDACAGRGGKTAALAAMVGGEAEIVAADRKASKLERLAFELERQGLRARTEVADLTAPGEALGRDFHRVLLDAPCSGCGTLGRRPEIRWRLRPTDVAALAEVQARMIDAAVGLLRPGGRLVFAVCSLLPEEGRDHLAPLLEARPEIRPVTEPPSGWPAEVPWREGFAEVDPVITRSDGYAILCLERRG